MYTVLYEIGTIGKCFGYFQTFEEANYYFEYIKEDIPEKTEGNIILEEFYGAFEMPRLGLDYILYKIYSHKNILKDKIAYHQTENYSLYVISASKDIDFLKLKRLNLYFGFNSNQSKPRYLELTLN